MLSFFARRLLGAGRRLAARLGPRSPRQCPPHPRQLWSIGLYAGPAPGQLSPARGVANPILTRADVTDVPAEFVADPFMVRGPDGWCMFFEVWNLATGRGEIGLATSDDGLAWRYQGVVLKEPYHLSYPYVFVFDGTYYMVPETYQAGSIRLYRATRFPDAWTFAGTLLEGAVFLDSSLVRFRDHWWMFTETNPQHRFDTLRLFYARDLLGPWQEHPRSPVVRDDPRRARPGGRVLAFGGRLIRHAQDCTPFYGTRVRAFEVTQLSTKTYGERELPDSPLLGPSGAGWNAWGMHHVDPHQVGEERWLACVDGWTEAPQANEPSAPTSEVGERACAEDSNAAIRERGPECR